ncbi:MAG: hypothetical protein ABIG28_03415 [archaeon]
MLFIVFGMIATEAIVYYLVLLDSIFAVLLAFCFHGWYKRHYKGFYRHFPATKGWVIWYLILVLWIGWALSRLGLLVI